MDEKKWERFFQREMDKEMEEIDGILEKMNTDPNMKEVVAPEAMYDNLMAQIHADKEEKERLSDEEKELIRLGKVYKKRRNWNKIVVLVAAVVCALAVGVTSMGGPEKVIEKVSWFLDEKEQTNIDSDSERVKEPDDVSEAEAYQQIEDEFGFRPVELVYLPDDMAFEEFNIDQSMQNIYMVYQGQNDEMITYIMYPNYRTSSVGLDFEDTLLNEYEKEVSDVVLSVKEYLVEENQANRYIISYEYQNVYYDLRLVNIKSEEVEKIIEKLYFCEK